MKQNADSEQAFIVAFESIASATQFLNYLDMGIDFECNDNEKVNHLWVNSIRFWYKGTNFSKPEQLSKMLYKTTNPDEKIGVLVDAAFIPLAEEMEEEIDVLQLALKF